ncbi:MAG: hypothetical protein M1812_002429 [Candelaria pacifica]|nr:MAG: hypothetical protein M1812_002429 [Candelaria pacifica]
MDQSRGNQNRKASSSSGSSFHATAMPFIPRLAPGISNPGSFYQPTPLITHSGPEQPPSPYYPLESATFMPPDTPVGSALPSPSFISTGAGGTYQLGGSPKDNDSGGVSLLRERSATSPAREVSFAESGEEDAMSSPSSHNRVISDLGPLPVRGFEQAMHSRRRLHEQSIWDQNWLQDPDRKWIESGRSRSSTTISPGALSNREHREQSDSQSTVAAEPTPRERMLRSLRDVANLPTQHLSATQPKVFGVSGLTDRQESNAGLSRGGGFRSSKLSVNTDSPQETFSSSSANPIVNGRFGNKSSRLENVVEEVGENPSLDHDSHLWSGTPRPSQELETRSGNIIHRNNDHGSTQSNLIHSAPTANVHWDQTPVLSERVNFDQDQPNMASYLTKPNTSNRIHTAGLQPRDSPVESHHYNQADPEHLSAVSRARAATTPLSLRQGHELGLDLPQDHDFFSEQGFGERGDSTPQARERAHTLALGYASEFSEQSADEYGYIGRAAPSTGAPQPPNNMSHTPAKGLTNEGLYLTGNATFSQHPPPTSQSPVGVRSFPYNQNQQTARIYRQQESFSPQRQAGMPQSQYQEDHLPSHNTMGYGQPDQAAYNYGYHGYGQFDYRQSGHAQNNADALGYGQIYNDDRHGPYNTGFAPQFQPRAGPVPYPGTPSYYPYQAALQPRSATGYIHPHLPNQDRRTGYLHHPFSRVAPLTGQSQNVLGPTYGSLQHMESPHHSRQPMAERHRFQQSRTQQPFTPMSPAQSALRTGGMQQPQQYRDGPPSMQYFRQPMQESSIQRSPQARYSNQISTQRHPLVELAPDTESAAPIVPYRAGTDIMYPISMGGPSSKYQDLLCNGRPSFEEASKKLPFIELARHAKPAEWGVLRIANIPYSVTKQEILAFLGRNAKIITPDLGCAIHIVMERPTGKTMDCFVEFLSSGDALAALKRFIRQKEEGRSGRIGDRHVDVEMSGQDSLMKELFPRAKNVVWHGASPAIFESTEPYNSGFKGFITSEEMVMTVKHAETPHRRTYESMISVLAKYPWWSVESYTLADRDLIFRATEQLVRALIVQLRREGTASPQINEQLLIELVYAGLNAPGFSEGQRARLVRSADWVGGRIRISPLASVWPFEVLGRKADIDEDVIEYFAACLREATTSSALVSLAEISLSRASEAVASPFGNVTVPWPTNKESMTMAAAAAVEWGVVENLLRKVLGGVVEGSQA